MHKTLQPILDILDEGLRIYRRGFTSFALLAAIWLTPVAIGIGFAFAAGAFWGSDAIFLLILGGSLLALPLAIYLFAAISRATLAIQQDQRVQFSKVLTIAPTRLMGMGCYGVVFGIIVNILVSMVSAFVCCPLYLAFMFLMTGVMSGVSSGISVAFTALLGVLGVLFLILIYGLNLVINGAVYSSVIYGLQPFVLDNLSFGASVQRSIDLTFYRTRRNLLAFILASAIFGGIAVAVTTGVGILLPLPLFWALGDESLVAQGISASAWLLGLIVVLPPVPIWMTLLYQQNLSAREGYDLARQIAALDPVQTQ
ncbi:MAG: hypothetical protein MI924_30610 [Chloroflexales bacterium]|nr:hypothetical protein [Chloroflexales bacterium]